MEQYNIMNILSFMTDRQVVQLSGHPWFKSWMGNLSPRAMFQFPMRELRVKVDELKCFDCHVINTIFSCYRCLVCHNSLRSDKNIIGGTDYIDQVTIQDMSGVINIGIDRFSRPYCTISGYMTDDARFKNKRYCFTMFQRYTDDTTAWQYGTCYPDLFRMSGSLSSPYNHDILHKIQALIQGTGYNHDYMGRSSSITNISYNPVYRHDVPTSLSSNDNVCIYRHKNNDEE